MLDTLMPIKTFVERYPHIGSKDTLRRWIREDFQGFRRTCAFRPGTQKYLVDAAKVHQWFEKRRLDQSESSGTDC